MPHHDGRNFFEKHPNNYFLGSVYSSPIGKLARVEQWRPRHQFALQNFLRKNESPAGTVTASHLKRPPIRPTRSQGNTRSENRHLPRQIEIGFCWSGWKLLDVAAIFHRNRQHTAIEKQIFKRQGLRAWKEHVINSDRKFHHGMIGTSATMQVHADDMEMKRQNSNFEPPDAKDSRSGSCPPGCCQRACSPACSIWPFW